MTKIATQENEFVINDMETLKVVADPLRMQLMALLKEGQTVKELARELEVPASKLYYHINQLETHGLIRIVGTHIVSGIIEKTYQTTAYEFRVSDQLLAPANLTDRTIEDLLGILFDQTKKDVRRSIQAGLITIPHPIGGIENRLLGRTQIAVTTEQYLVFVQRFGELVQEFINAGTPPHTLSSPDTEPNPLHTYNLTIALYPVHIKQSH